jgi:hypothetical protein
MEIMTEWHEHQLVLDDFGAHPYDIAKFRSRLRMIYEFIYYKSRKNLTELGNYSVKTIYAGYRCLIILHNYMYHFTLATQGRKIIILLFRCNDMTGYEYYTFHGNIITNGKIDPDNIIDSRHKPFCYNNNNDMSITQLILYNIVMEYNFYFYQYQPMYVDVYDQKMFYSIIQLGKILDQGLNTNLSFHFYIDYIAIRANYHGNVWFSSTNNYGACYIPGCQIIIQYITDMTEPYFVYNITSVRIITDTHRLITYANGQILFHNLDTGLSYNITSKK